MSTIIERCIAKLIIMGAMIVSSAFTYTTYAQLVSHFTMDLQDGKIIDKQTGNSFSVMGCLEAEAVEGIEGTSLRFDGYSSFVPAKINIEALDNQELTFSLWYATETYPMMNPDLASNEFTYIAGNLDNDAKSGFAFLLSSQGDYTFVFYLSGWRVSCAANSKLSKYQWNYLAAVVDIPNKVVNLYNNNKLVGQTPLNVEGSISSGKEDFMIGKSFADIKSGPFLLNTINGILDEVRVYNKALSLDDLNKVLPENRPSLYIPDKRFENDLLRPKYHGMPEAAWTNEPHGLIYHEGKYHLFFQKNANGPYWGKLHWGHITSENLYDWNEEKIVLAPSEAYDMKGCWSGCVYMDSEMTQDLPYIYYTAVDNEKASIASAIPSSHDLIDWDKTTTNPIISQRPSGLSDDLRDPYIFSNNGEHYMIVGASHNNIGAATLHKYNKTLKTWSNDGTVFFKGNNAAIAGRYWEMPVCVPMNDGKWLFLVTPLESRRGVETLYWVGTLNDDATFNPLPTFINEPKEVDLGNISEHGYGMLSPSLCKLDDNKYVAVRIEPDKLSSEYNHSLGWAHTFSLPRELTIDSNNNLIQKPYSKLNDLRSNVKYNSTNNQLEGSQSLNPISGRSLELLINFKVGDSEKVGFKIFKTGNRAVEIYYEHSLNKISVDARNIDRWKNDEGFFNGLYEAYLPERLTKGHDCKLNVFVDHSIIDIFINDKWAFSLRVFPTDELANDVEVYSEGGVTSFDQINAWVLDKQNKDVGINETTKKNGITLTTLGNQMIYDNVEPGSDIYIHTASGIMIHQEKASGSNGVIKLSTPKMYIVTVKNTAGVFSQKILNND